MFDTLDFAQDILGQEINPVCADEGLGGLPLNRQYLTAIVSYQHLTDGWDDTKPTLLTQKRWLSWRD